jgi:hypothetical protein
MVSGAWCLVVALGATEQALAAALEVVEGCYDIEERELTARYGELESAVRSPGGCQDATLREHVKGLRKVVAGHRELFGDRLDRDGVPIPLLSQVQNGSKRIFGGLGDHRVRILVFLMRI